MFSCACYRDMYTKEPFYGYDKKERDSVIKAGYKQTELGVIPDDWEVKAVEEISDVRSGKRLPLGNSLTDKETPYPYIRVADMEIGTIVLDDIKYIPPDVYPCIKNYRIFEEDIFISVAGSLGIVGKIPSQLNGANLTENADRLTKISIDRDYLMYMLMSPLIQNTIESEKTLGAQPKLALIRIRQFNIPLPPTKTEQTAIAKALSDTDALIQSLSQLIVKKRQIKQGAMQALLNPYDETGALKSDWVVKRLSEIADLATGNTPSTKDKSNYEGKFLFVSPADLGKRKWISQTEKTLSTKGFSLARKFPANSILFTCIGSTIGKSGLAAEELTSNQQINAVLPNSSFCSEYLYYFLDLISSAIQASASEQAVPIINKTQFGETQIYIPNSKNEQKQISKTLSDMDTEITALETKLSKYQKIKQGMMQNLLTGRIRLV